MYPSCHCAPPARLLSAYHRYYTQENSAVSAQYEPSSSLRRFRHSLSTECFRRVTFSYPFHPRLAVYSTFYEPTLSLLFFCLHHSLTLDAGTLSEFRSCDSPSRFSVELLFRLPFTPDARSIAPSTSPRYHSHSLDPLARMCHSRPFSPPIACASDSSPF